jgi:hypothetical protein
VSRGRLRDLADIAHEVRWAALVVGAAIPLAAPAGPGPSGHAAADRTALRAGAFKLVLAELMDCEIICSAASMDELLAGRLPSGMNEADEPAGPVS